MKIYIFRLALVFSCFGELLQWNTYHNFAAASSELRIDQGQISMPPRPERPAKDICSVGLNLLPRPHSVSITEFGAVGDGVTTNTHAFQNAIFYVRSFADKGGAQLFVPAGMWLTGSFNLTSHLTLFLDKDAVILGTEDPNWWPVIDPLPSYGRGRELPGGRHISLIHGEGLVDVIITGENGTIDGQGAVWWQKYHNKTLEYTRGHLVELINSKDIVISNLTFLNSPFWNIHPVYCSNVFIQNVTILAPWDSPNTDGIDPDSSMDVCIQDCFISTGDDLISIKSGWDEYGIKYGRPSSNIVIRHVVGSTYTSAGIAIGSEMSGGVSEVYVNDMLIYNVRTGIYLKTSRGRGGYIRDIFISNMDMINANIAIRFSGSYGDHPDDEYDPHALPVVEKIFIENITGKNITFAGQLEGLPDAPFKDIHLSNISLDMDSLDETWNCSNVWGFSESVYPEPCRELQTKPNRLSLVRSFTNDVDCKDS
eukprot:c25122_g1_i1 orf=212-1654(+)